MEYVIAILVIGALSLMAMAVLPGAAVGILIGQIILQLACIFLAFSDA